jgi:hypothetical protein
MTMPSSGALNMGGTSSPVSVNFELGRASPYNQTVSMNDSVVRTLAGVSGTSGSTWSMNSLYGRSNVTISLASVEANEPYEGLPPAGGEPGEATLTFFSDGTWDAYLGIGAGKSGNWATPTTAGVGAGYWIRFTRTAYVPNGASNSASGTTGWLQLNSGFGQGVFVTRVSGPGATFATYTIEISTNSSGTNIVATAVNIDVSALYY